MPTPQSLADYLGVPDRPPAGETQESLAAKVELITDGKEFGLAVLNSLEFRRYILLGLTLGTLPGFASILGRLMDHAIGKAPERVEHTGKDGGPIDVVQEVRRVIVRPSDETQREQLEEEAAARSIRYTTH